MSYTKIAVPRKYDEGLPVINLPSVIGASPNRPFLQKIPVLGKRPLKIEILPFLPDGLVLDETEGILTGSAAAKGNYELTVRVSNAMGSTSKKVMLEIDDDHILRTPLLGWTSWNAYGKKITQDLLLETARFFHDSGLLEYGYTYMNLDSTWQGEYGGDYYAIQANEKFPDMKAMCGFIHSMGMKCGIYSTPMLAAWGHLPEEKKLPGCTQGDRDMDFPDTNGGVGLLHYEENNVRQWAEWGFDYLKYDWYYCDPVNAERMKNALLQSGRDFGFCVSVYADIKYAQEWKRLCSSWRDNTDSVDKWEIVKKILLTADKWLEHAGNGHYFDLDMLEIGVMSKGHPCELSEDEQILAYSLRALFPSPIQISCQVDKLTDFDFALLCNEEVLAVNQDALGLSSRLVYEDRQEDAGRHVKIYRKDLEDGGSALGFFNFGESAETVSYDFPKGADIRDLWMKENMSYDKAVGFDLQPHTVRLVKIFKEESDVCK